MGVKRIAIGVPVLIVLAFVAAAAVWWFAIREDDKLATNAPDIPADLVDPTAGATVRATATSGEGGGQTYVITPERSEAAYFAGETLANVGLPSTAKGATTAIEGQFHLTDDGFALDTTQESTFTVDLTTLESDEDRRDNRVQGALETGMFPTATFTIMSVSGVEPATFTDGVEHAFQITGVLDLHGVQKELTWDVKARREGNVMTALAIVEFRFDDFNITKPDIGGFVSVEEDVTLQVQIVAQSA